MIIRFLRASNWSRHWMVFRALSQKYYETKSQCNNKETWTVTQFVTVQISRASRTGGFIRPCFLHEYGPWRCQPHPRLQQRQKNVTKRRQSAKKYVYATIRTHLRDNHVYCMYMPALYVTHIYYIYIYVQIFVSALERVRQYDENHRVLIGNFSSCVMYIITISDGRM